MEIKITISETERAELDEIVRRGKDMLLFKRAFCILRLSEGVSVKLLSKQLMVDDTTIYGWVRKFNKAQGGGGDINDGIKGSKYHREGKLSSDDKESLKVYFRAHPPMNTQEAIEHIKSQFGVEYSDSWVSRLLGELGFEYKAPKLIIPVSSVKEQEEFIEKYQDLANNLPEDEAIYFGDAVHPQHQSKPTHGWFFKEDKPVLKSNTGRMRDNYLGALNIKTGSFNFENDETINAESVVKILKKLQLSNPNLRKIHYFVDNARYFHSKIVKEHLSSSECRVKLHFLPAYSPHLNPIERLWGVMHKYVTHNKYYAKYADFCNALLDFFRRKLPDNWNTIKQRVTDNFRVIEPHPI